LYQQNESAHAWFSAPSGTAGNAITFTQAMTLDASGNLGIGTSSPATKLHVVGANTSGKGQFVLASASAGQEARMTFVDGSDDIAEISTDGNNLYFYTEQASGAFLWYTNGSERARIDSSGNVGIGTSSPAYKLNIVEAKTLTPTTGDGQITIDNSTSGQVSAILFSSQATRRAQISAGLGGSGNDGFLAFTTRNDSTGFGERARIDASGNFLVGTTTVNPHSTGTYGSQLSVGGALIGVNDSHAIIAARWNGNGEVIRLQRDNTDVGSIDVTTTATSYNTSSDYRLKNTIVPMTGALAKVALLKPCTYKWNANGSDGEGFIAHELAEVCPDAVTGAKDAVDAEGNPQYQGIDTSFLVATLTAALQELDAKFEAYKASHP
jgi:hypothetical protein